jgi:predicted RND superfamily exporter protein
VFVCGIAGLIISSVAGNNEGVVLTIGVATAVASIVLLAVSSVTSTRRIEVFDEAKAERLENEVQTLVAAGADEQAVRTLVRQAMQLGRR